MDITLQGADVLDRDLAEYPSKVTRALVRSLNRGLNSGVTFMSRSIARDIGLKVGDVKAAFVVQQATATRLSARFGTNLKRIPIGKFNPRGPEPTRGRGRGVSYRSGGVTKRIEDAFLATMASGHRGVFIRAKETTRKSRGAWSPNLPIVELHGPSLGQVFRKFRPAGIVAANESLAKNLSHELDRILKQQGGGDGAAD